MSDSTPVIADLLLTANAAGQAAKANDLFNAGSPAMLYAINPATTTGLTLGLIGGRFLADDDGSVAIPNQTKSLTASSTNYVVAEKATGDVSVATTNTNWGGDDDDPPHADYIRLYKVVTGLSSITSFGEYRQAIGASGGGGGGTTPGGSDTQVQFNDGGAFGGDSGLVFNKGTDTLTGVNLTATGLILTAASASGGAGIRLPHGAAPSSPTNGDVWTTTSGLFARIDGATVGPFGTGGGGSPGGSSGQVQWNNSSAFGGITNFTTDGTNITAFTMTGAKATFAATATGYASINLPHGTAPSSPSNGDLWTTTTGVFARINGATVGPFAAGGSAGSSAEVQFSNGSGGFSASSSFRWLTSPSRVSVTSSNTSGAANPSGFGAIRPNNSAFTGFYTTDVAHGAESGLVFHGASTGTFAAGGVALHTFASGSHIFMAPNSVANAIFRTSGNTLIGSTNTESAGAEKLQVQGSLSISSATLIRTYTAFTNGAGSGAGTLTNAPAAGDPTKWIPINDNGTTRYIPAW